jgi:hypothetical protein
MSVMGPRWLRRWLVLLIVLGLSGSAALGVAWAQGTGDFAALRGRVNQLHRQGKYTEAAAIAERYVVVVPCGIVVCARHCSTNPSRD